MRYNYILFLTVPLVIIMMMMMMMITIIVMIMMMMMMMMLMMILEIFKYLKKILLTFFGKFIHRSTALLRYNCILLLLVVGSCVFKRKQEVYTCLHLTLTKLSFYNSEIFQN